MGAEAGYIHAMGPPEEHADTLTRHDTLYSRKRGV